MSTTADAGILSLPAAVLCTILALVDQRDRSAAARACRRLHAAVEDPASNPEASFNVDLGIRGDGAERAAAGAVNSAGRLRVLLASPRFGSIDVLRIRLKLWRTYDRDRRCTGTRRRVAPAPAVVVPYAPSSIATAGLGAALVAAAPSLRRLELMLRMPGELKENGAVIESVELQLAVCVPQLRELAIRCPSDPREEIPASALISALGGIRDRTHRNLRRVEVGVRLDSDSPVQFVQIPAAAPALSFISQVSLHGTSTAAASLAAMAAAGVSTGDLRLISVNLAAVAEAVAAAARSAESIALWFDDCELPGEWHADFTAAACNALVMSHCHLTPAAFDAVARAGIAGSVRKLRLYVFQVDIMGCSGGDIVDLLQRMPQLQLAELWVPWDWEGYADLLRRLVDSGIDLAAVTVEGVDRRDLQSGGEFESVPHEALRGEAYDAYTRFEAARRRALLARSGAATREELAPRVYVDPHRNIERSMLVKAVRMVQLLCGSPWPSLRHRVAAIFISTCILVALILIFLSEVLLLVIVDILAVLWFVALLSVMKAQRQFATFLDLIYWTFALRFCFMPALEYFPYLVVTLLLFPTGGGWVHEKARGAVRRVCDLRLLGLGIRSAPRLAFFAVAATALAVASAALTLTLDGCGCHPWAALAAAAAPLLAAFFGHELGTLPPATSRERSALAAHTSIVYLLGTTCFCCVLHSHTSLPCLCPDDERWRSPFV